MLNLPAPPETLVTRSLHCVSCREQFTVSEGNTRGVSTPTPDHYPDIGLRYQPNLTRRPIVPESRAAPEETAALYDGPGPIHIVCPRCGADNRNWLRLTTISTPWYRRFRLAGLAIPLAIGFMLFVAGLLFFDPLLIENIPFTLRLAMLVFILVSGIVTSWNPTRDWLAMRDQVNETRYLPNRKKRPFSLLRLILLAFTLSVVVPLIAFAILPTLIDKAPELISPPASRTTISRITSLLEELTSEMVDEATTGQQANLQTAAIGIQTAVNNKQTTCNTLPIQDAITTLTNLNNNTLQDRQQIIAAVITRLTFYNASNAATFCRTELLQSTITQLATLQTIESNSSNATQCQQNNACYTEVIQTLERQLEHMLTNDTFPNHATLYEQISLALQNARTFHQNTPDGDTEAIIIDNLAIMESFVNRKTDGIVLSKVFFVNWLVFVGIAATVGTIMGHFATEEYAKSINRQLPPPVYATVANMTRVVIWEAHRALEIQRPLHEIQWLEATRNEDGGITLTGIERDMPDFDALTNNFSDRVRAQKYHIVSDHLAHIISATVSDVLVKRSLAGPAIAYSGWEQALPAVPARDQDRRLPTR